MIGFKRIWWLSCVWLLCFMTAQICSHAEQQHVVDEETTLQQEQQQSETTTRTTTMTVDSHQYAEDETSKDDATSTVTTAMHWFDHLNELFEKALVNSNPWLVLLYQPNDDDDADDACTAHRNTLHDLLEGTLPYWRKEQEEEKHDSTIPAMSIQLGIVPVLDPKVLVHAYGIQNLPTLAILHRLYHNHNHLDDDDDAKKEEGESLFYYYYLVEYTGLLTDTHQVYTGVTHYLDALSILVEPTSQKQHQHGQSSTSKETEEKQDNDDGHPLLLVQPKRFNTLSDMFTFWKVYQNQRWKKFTKPPSLVLSPDLQPYRPYLEFIWGTPEPELLLFVQCYPYEAHDAAMDAFEIFQKFSRVVAGRRDRFFFRVADCDRPGDVQVYFIPTSFTTSSYEDEQYMDDLNKHSWRTCSAQELYDCLIQTASDVVLFLDRQMTAPIAFSKSRKIHAVLVIDMLVFSDRNKTDPHHQDIAMKHQNAISEFRELCQQNKLSTTQNDEDMVCLVVPKTDQRVLNTFEIDIYFENHTALLPTLFVTDQRYGGTRRYYRTDSAISMSEFIHAFWENRLEYAIASSLRPPRTNRAGIRILNAQSIVSELQSTQQHKLIAFVSSTCGHCKRFLVIYNQLGNFLRYIGWDKILKLFLLNVAENDLEVTNIPLSVDWLPDVYYQSPNSSDFVRYNIVDTMGDGVGGIRRPTDLLEWLIHDVGILESNPEANDDLNHHKIQKLLTALETIE